MIARRLLALLTASLLQAAAAEKVLYEGSMEKLLFRTVLVEPGRFSKNNVEALGRHFLKDSEGLKLAKLSIFSREGDAVTTLFGKGTDHVGYRSWLTSFSQLSRRGDPMADVIVINGAAVLRYRDAASRVGRVALAGEDPLVVRVGEVEFEIIDVVFPRLPPVSASGGSDVQVYLTTAAPFQEEHGYALTGHLSEVFGARDLQVHVRNDTWFIGNTWFPYFYRFQDDLSPPTHDEYYRSEQLGCLKKVTGFTCAKYHPVDEAGKHPLRGKE